MQCEHCRKIVSNDSIKMVPKLTHEAVCHICRGEYVKEPQRAKVKIVERMDDMPIRGLFFCTKCNYKFRKNIQSSVNLYCPWCGKADNTTQLS